MNRYDKVLELLRNMEDSEIISIHNEYCRSVRYYDHEVFEIDMFDEIAGNMEPLEIAHSCFFGGFNPTHSYFWFNGYGNLASADYIDETPVDLEEIAAYIDDNDDSLCCDDIAELLEQEVS